MGCLMRYIILLKLVQAEISALHQDAQLIHEAAIGKIASDQLIKLMSLGLSEKEAEDTVLKGFLR